MKIFQESTQPKEEKTVQLVVFQAGSQNFAVPIHRVREILAYRKATPLPQSAPFLEGMIEVRGKLVPVYDLRKKLGISEFRTDSHSRIIVLGTGKKKIGLIVDSVLRVVTLPPEGLQPPPDTETPYANFVLAVAVQEGQLYIILDPEKLGVE